MPRVIARDADHRGSRELALEKRERQFAVISVEMAKRFTCNLTAFI
jgi:hypothetical protein